MASPSRWRSQLGGAFGMLLGLGAFYGARHLLRDDGPHFPAEWHLAPADDERLFRIMEEESRAFHEHPELLRRARDAAEAAAPGEDAHAVGYALGADITARGLWRLTPEDLREWNRIRLVLAASEPVCLGLWTGVTPPADLFAALARLSDADLRSWIRLTSRAGVLELEGRVGDGAPSVAPASDDATFALALETLGSTMPEADRATFDAELAASETDDAAGCRWIRTVMSLAAAPSSEGDAILRYLAGPPP